MGLLDYAPYDFVLNHSENDLEKLVPHQAADDGKGGAQGFGQGVIDIVAVNGKALFERCAAGRAHAPAQRMIGTGLEGTHEIALKISE